MTSEFNFSHSTVYRSTVQFDALKCILYAWMYVYTSLQWQCICLNWLVLAGNHQQRLQTDMDHLQRNTSVRTCLPYIISCDHHNTKLAGWLYIYILFLPSRKVRQLIIIITITVYTYMVYSILQHQRGEVQYSYHLHYEGYRDATGLHNYTFAVACICNRRYPQLYYNISFP